MMQDARSENFNTIHWHIIRTEKMGNQTNIRLKKIDAASQSYVI